MLRDVQTTFEGPVVFGMPESDDQVMTKAIAKERYFNESCRTYAWVI